MIRRLVVRDPKLAIVPWWDKVESLKNLSEVTFGENLNVLWGRNGAGKSTLLQALAKLTHCDQGGTTKVTQASLSEFFPLFDRGDPKFGLVLEHDARAVLSFTAGKSYGVMGGSFDDDFFDLGMRHMRIKGSSGQLQGYWLGELLKTRPSWPQVQWTMSEAHVNSLWAGKIRRLREELFTAQIPAGPPTILFDEPDRSLDLDAQAALWRALPKIAAEGFQIIAASHSVFARDVPGAHYIELSPGYLSACRDLRTSS